MTNQKQLRSCRSKSRGRQSNREPHTPSSNAKATSSKESHSPSPARDEGIPSEVNNAEKEGVAESPRQVSPDTGTKGSESQMTNTSNDLGNESITPQPVNVNPDQTDNHLTPPGVGDNRELPKNGPSGESDSLQIPPELAKEDPGKALLLVLSELRDIKTQMVKLHQLESTTASMVGQLATNTSKMGELVETVSQNKANIEGVGRDLDSLKDKVDKQSSQLVNLQDMKGDMAESTDKAVSKMNELIDIQRDQVESFNSGAKQLQKDWKREVMDEVNKKFEDLGKQKHYQSLKDQAFRNRYNLVVGGLTEEAEKTTVQIVKNFFSETLQTPDVQIRSAQRLGSQEATASKYNRPILVRFDNWADRNVIWRKRAAIPDNKDNKYRIQADLPKELREGIPTLYKVANAASKIKEFTNVRVHDYQLELNGKAFQISDLEQLPSQIRPSSLAETKSDTHLVFFSRHSKLSNHHPSEFTVKGQRFASMEQFLATRRAELSGKEDLIKKAQDSQDPVQAKHILNALHGDHQQEWDQQLEVTAMDGLRAKFTQNRSLRDHLCSTGELTLGEASTNKRWGIGMDINNKEVLDQTKWSTEGNLLGRSLMNLRSEFIKKMKKTKQ